MPTYAQLRAENEQLRATLANQVADASGDDSLHDVIATLETRLQEVEAELDAAYRRIAELRAASATAGDQAPETAPETVDYDSQTVSQLQARLERLDLPKTGSKSTLIERLRAAEGGDTA